MILAVMNTTYIVEKPHQDLNPDHCNAQCIHDVNTCKQKDQKGTWTLTNFMLGVYVMWIDESHVFEMCEFHVFT